VHAYGVFPPHSPPAMKLSPVTEVTWDGDSWHPLVHRFWPTLETSRPRFCAPHHDRFDQAVVYEALGLNEATVFRNVVGRWDPYVHGGISAPLRMVRRMLEGTLPGSFYDRALERQNGPPTAARVRTHMLEPTTWRDVQESGRWWKRTLVGPHFPPMTLKDGYWEAPLPPPELWHFEDLFWLRRSHLGRVMQHAAAGEDPHALIATRAPELTADDVDDFWNDFLPAIGARHRDDWKGLRKTVEELRERYGRPRLYRFERIANRYAVCLLAKIWPSFVDRGIAPVFGRAKASLDVSSLYHLRLLTHHIVAEGRTAFDAVIGDPRIAQGYADRMTMSSSNRLLALFRYETLVYQAQKLRLMAACLEHGGRPEPTEKERIGKARIDAIARRLFGVLDVVDFLKTQFLEEEDVLDVPEQWPAFFINERAEVVRIGAEPDRDPASLPG
jgi:hypothetical protein